MNIKAVFIFSLFLSTCFISPSFCMDEETKNERSIQTAIKTLGPNHSFSYYDLPISESEKHTLEKLSINSTIQYNNYANPDALESEIASFIKEIGKDNEARAKEVSQVIVRIAKQLIQSSGEETAWVAVRSFIPCQDYDLPRWHIDGEFFKTILVYPYKFALALKGSPTLFYQLPENRRKEFIDLLNKGSDQNNYNRQPLAEMLANSKDLIAVGQPYQGAVFIVGNDDYAAVHSEPPLKEGRLFLSVLPGSEEQIKEWETQ